MYELHIRCLEENNNYKTKLMHEILLDNIIPSWADHGQHQVIQRFYCAGKVIQLRIIQDYNHHDYTSVLGQ